MQRVTVLQDVITLHLCIYIKFNNTRAHRHGTVDPRTIWKRNHARGRSKEWVGQKRVVNIV